MIVDDIITEISSVVQDNSWSEENILSIINRGVNTIASGVLIPGKYQKTSPLPDLYTFISVDTIPNIEYISMPENYQRGLLQVLDSNFEDIKMENSFLKFLKQNREKKAGNIHTCSLNGKTLYFRDIPSSAETIVLHYFKKPEEIDFGQEPDSIPEFLQLPILQAYTCQYIFNQIEDGIEGQKVNTSAWYEKYVKLLLELDIELGYDEGATFVNDTRWS